MSNSQPTGLKANFPTWSDYSMNFVVACLNVDPSKRPQTEDLMNYSVFSHDNFNIWFVADLQLKLQEEFSSNPLLKIRKQPPSAKKTKIGNEESLNKNKVGNPLVADRNVINVINVFKSNHFQNVY